MIGKKVCFVIAPMGEEGSETRHRSERVFEDVIKPAARRCRYTAVHAMSIARPGLITNGIIRHIVNDQLVIADLTGGNPNVFYELALRHAERKPIVHIIATGEEIPFDLKDTRTISFDIDVVRSRSEAINEIVKQIKDMETDPAPLETPVSAAGVAPLMSFAQSEAPPSTGGVQSSEMTLREWGQSAKIVPVELEGLAPAEALPALLIYIDALTKDSRVRLLRSPIDDLDAAHALVNSVPEGGRISATFSLQNENADEREGFRTAVNLALERNVTYRKVIGFGSELWPERRDKWLVEFTDKADLIKKGRIKPDAFQLLHYPAPLSVDVLISQDADYVCQEMVAGFAGGGGQHGGFRTDDKRMVEVWLNIYVEAKIIAEAERHTKAVLEHKESCHCSEFLKLLDDARRAASPSKKLTR